MLNQLDWKSVHQLTTEFGTPLYVYDSDEIKNSFNSLRSALSSKVKIFYSLKANPNISICSYLSKLGANLEVCSEAELETAIKIGISPKNIIFVGPAKTKAELTKCIKHEILAIVCESLTELTRTDIIAKSLNKKISVALRINPEFSAETAPLKMGGKPSQFGMDLELIYNNEDKIFSKKNVEIIAIHIYNGTRILEAKTIAENTQSIFDLAKNLMQRWNRKFSFIDIGGGLGIPYFNDEAELNMEELNRLMNPVITSFTKDYPSTDIILESGRFLIGKAGMLLSQINNIKVSKGEHYLITDGGTNCHMAAVGIGSFIKRNFPISAFSKNNTTEYCEYNISGPLCTPGDLIAKKIKLPKQNIGDLIAIHHSGAYGPTASPVLFLSHGYPAEVMLVNNKAHLIRERDKVCDLLAKQILIQL